MPLRQPVTLQTFADEFLVVCPGCARKARVQASTVSRPARLTCIECGTSKFMAAAAKGVLVSSDSTRWPKGQYALGDAADPYFHLPLWLQISCAAGVVWAFNERHLDYLDEYVSSEQRHRPFRTASEPKNALLESRLPRWMKLAKNRAEIVDAIRKLRGQQGSRA